MPFEKFINFIKAIGDVFSSKPREQQEPKYEEVAKLSSTQTGIQSLAVQEFYKAAKYDSLKEITLSVISLILKSYLVAQLIALVAILLEGSTSG